LNDSIINFNLFKDNTHLNNNLTKKNDKVIKSSILNSNLNYNKINIKRSKSLISKNDISNKRKNLINRNNNNSFIYDIEMKDENNNSKLLTKSFHSKSLINIKSKQKLGERKSIFKPNIEISMNMNKYHLLKRGISNDTYSYYQSKKKYERMKNYSPIHSLNFIKQKSKGKKEIKRNSIYTPRLFNDKILKKWEELNKKNWYNLTPLERSLANQEMEKMIKK
jgi:hypothetical protein